MGTHLHDAHELVGGVVVQFRDVQSLARKLADADDQVWVTLDHEDRLRYEQLARAAVIGLGIEIVAVVSPSRAMMAPDDT